MKGREGEEGSGDCEGVEWIIQSRRKEIKQAQEEGNKIFIYIIIYGKIEKRKMKKDYVIFSRLFEFFSVAYYNLEIEVILN